MGLSPYLAMTGAEIQRAETLPPQLCYMACHFSPYGTGLTGLPRQLPEGALLMVTDRTPIFGHDPSLIYRQLEQAMGELQCRGLILDFQRTGVRETEELVKALEPLAPVVSHCYSSVTHGPVLLPPLPLWTKLKAHLEPWKGRPVWLEAAVEGALVEVTSAGSLYEALPWEEWEGFFDEGLHITYRTEVLSDSVRFHLNRGPAQLKSLLQEAEEMGVTGAVGLFQQLGHALPIPVPGG